MSRPQHAHTAPAAIRDHAGALCVEATLRSQESFGVPACAMQGARVCAPHCLGLRVCDRREGKAVVELSVRAFRSVARLIPWFFLALRCTAPLLGMARPNDHMASRSMRRDAGPLNPLISHRSACARHHQPLPMPPPPALPMCTCAERYGTMSLCDDACVAPLAA